MSMIGHETISPAEDAIRRAALGEEIARERVAPALDEQRLQPVATLRDMMR
jgi:hypothetical protein